MLTRDYRPQSLQDICGQSLAVEAIKAISRDPEQSPRVLVFHGDYGTGKTSLVRILARALNCSEHKFMCGQCETCRGTLDFVPFYQEFDSALIGNKEDILDLRDDLYVQSNLCAYRVVVLDEFHLASKASQGALLKVLEDLPNNVYVVFCTTDVNSIIPTLRSRAVEVPFTLASREEIKSYLVKVVNSAGIDIPDDVLDIIAEQAGGHVRDAVMTLNKYTAMNDVPAFLAGIRSARTDAAHYLLAARTGDAIQTRIRALSSYPSSVVQQEIFNLVTKALEASIKDTDESGKTGQNLREVGDPSPKAVIALKQDAEVEDREGTMYLPPSPQDGPVEHAEKSTAPDLCRSGNDLSSVSLDSSSIAIHTVAIEVAVASTTSSPSSLVPEITRIYGRDLISLVAFLCTDWAVNALGDSVRLQAFLWSLHLTFKQGQTKQTQRYHRKQG